MIPCYDHLGNETANSVRIILISTLNTQSGLNLTLTLNKYHGGQVARGSTKFQNVKLIKLIAQYYF